MPGKPLTFKATATEADYLQLLKVGLSPRQAQFITGPDALTSAAAKKRYRRAFSKHQFVALTDSPTMASLLKAHFTRHQAKLILRALAA